MKKNLGLILTLLIFTGIVQAAPNSTFTATAPTQYESGEVIPATDTLTYTVYCGDKAGGPYLSSFPNVLLIAGTVIDVALCVNGVPGTYFFVATATSTVFASESLFSNEVIRTYSAAELGRVPNAPTLFTVQ